MPKLVKTTSVHEKTVQMVGNGDHKSVYKSASRTVKPRLSRKRNSKVQKTHWYDGLDPRILAWVRKNSIYWARVEIISPTAVIVHNDLSWRK